MKQFVNGGLPIEDGLHEKKMTKMTIELSSRIEREDDSVCAPGHIRSQRRQQPNSNQDSNQNVLARLIARLTLFSLSLCTDQCRITAVHQSPFIAPSVQSLFLPPRRWLFCKQKNASTSSVGSGVEAHCHQQQQQQHPKMGSQQQRSGNN